MTLFFALSVLIISAGMDVETPEEFLATLSSSNADQWIEFQYPAENSIHPDTVKIRIESLRSLSVDPGERILEDIEGGYRVVFPESRWTWRMDGGRIGSVRGESVVEWHPGGYSWTAIPVFSEDGVSMGRRESLCMGATMMAAIGVIGIFAVWYAKRRYG
ncbi:MAG: hypothetical protein U9P42_09525 [Candidatus Fermentibacteria bacterium]|nr:hypothetical protein [Candidatus Fermentibacteria bacterium]